MKNFPQILALVLVWAIGLLGFAEEVTNPPFEEILKIDVHSHVFEDVPGFADMMRENNLRIINICVRGTDLERMKEMDESARKISAKYPSLFWFASTFDVTRIDAREYVGEVTSWLDRTYEAGAVMTKIWKEVGMEVKKRDGSFLMPDDPLLDPVYDHLRKHGKPLIAHLAEPIQAWKPLDPDHAFHGYYAENPEWHMYNKPEFQTYDQIIASRDHLLLKHPNLVVIGAHMGSMSHDVDEIARRLDRFPNFHVECAARTVLLTRQPADKVRNFFIRYQDRIMYGLDGGTPGKNGMTEQDIAEFVKSREDQYRLDYQYYAGSGSMKYWDKEVKCLNLPTDVLEKFYFRNAQRIIPGLKI